MDTLMHADIFFFVTTIAVVVVALCFTIALIYLIVILKRVRDIADQIREETILFREDVHELRDQVKRTGFQAKAFLSFFKNSAAHFVGNFFGGDKKSKKSK